MSNNNKQSSVDAYCNSCDAFICDALVTFEETCSKCGTEIEYFENEISNNKQTSDNIVDANNKQSSVEWYSNEIGKITALALSGKMTGLEWKYLQAKALEEAKAMHITEHEKTWNNAINAVEKDKWDSFEQYYNETFNNYETN